MNRRVAIFTETWLPRVDGIVNTLRWTLRGLVEAGWEPMLVTPCGNTQAFPGVQVVAAPSVRFPLYPEVRLGYPTPPVWRLLDQFEPSVVHLAGPVTNGFGGMQYAVSRGVPIVSTYHTALPTYAQLYGLPWLVEPTWRFLRMVHNSGAVTLCPSRVTIEDLRAHGFRRLELWSRGVDTNQFTPDRRSADMRARLGAGPSDLLLVYVGRLAREKKLERLADAVRSLSGVHVALVGTGPDRDQLVEVFDGLPVTFAGVLHGPELAAAYASADVFAFPSDTETFGNVVLEAMACGLPVVATTSGGQIDLLSPGTNGLLFAPEDVAAFAAHITTYRDDPLLRSCHGAAGLAIARARTWPNQVDLLIRHYETAVDGRSRTESTIPREAVGIR